MNRLRLVFVNLGCLLLSLFVVSMTAIAEVEDGAIGGVGGTGAQEDEEIIGGIGGTGVRDMERPELLERPDLLDARDILDDIKGDGVGNEDASPDLPDVDRPESQP